MTVVTGNIIDIGQSHAEVLAKSSRSTQAVRWSARSSAICAVVLYVVIALISIYLYSRYYEFAVASLPRKTDVLMAGSSVIAIPLIGYEFPQRDIPLALDRAAVIETPKTERLLSLFGACDPCVYNSSSLGQTLDETRQILQQVIAQKKDVRMLVLWLTPISVVGERPPQMAKPYANSPVASTNPEITLTNSQLLDRLKRPIKDFREGCKNVRHAVQLRLCHRISLVFWTLLPSKSALSVYWDKVQRTYLDIYSKRVLEQRRLRVLADILNMCKSHSIKTLVVSAPLSAQNRSLMKPGYYDEYRRTLQAIVLACQGDASLEEGQGFIDLGASPDFIEPSDFHDPAHCNGIGGAKMLRSVAPKIVQLMGGAGSSGLKQ